MLFLKYQNGGVGLENPLVLFGASEISSRFGTGGLHTLPETLNCMLYLLRVTDGWRIDI